MQLKKVILKKKQTYDVESLQGEGLRMKYAELFGQKDSCQQKVNITSYAPRSS